MDKQAVARWREAIYSGELPPESANKLRQQMKLTPSRMAQGLNKGTANILKRIGYETISKVPSNVMAMSLGPNIAASIPAIKKTILPPESTPNALARYYHNSARQLANDLRALPPAENKLVDAIFRRHEADEGRVFERIWKKAPQSRLDKFQLAPEQANYHKVMKELRKGSTGGKYSKPDIALSMPSPEVYRRNAVARKTPMYNSHLSPSVVLNEARHYRAAPSYTRTLLENLRHSEVPASLKIPKRDIARIAKMLLAKARF